MAFTLLQNEDIYTEKNLICPLTHKLFQDPVLAGDGHIYERSALVQWIEVNGTSPITLEPLKISDLRIEENIKRLCQSQPPPVAYSTGNDEVRLPPLRVSQMSPIREQPPIVAEVQRSFNNNNCISYMWCIGISIILVILIIIASMSLSVKSRSTVPSTYAINTSLSPLVATTTIIATDSTTYILPNNCTLRQITPVFSLNNSPPFDFQFYSIPYTAIAEQTMITFAFRQDPGYWAIDDISMRENKTGIEVLQNGDFENEVFALFSYCNQQGINVTSTAYPSNNQSHSGTYAFVDFTANAPDYISQMLTLTIGNIYNISFFLLNSDGPVNSFMVMMSV
ncbi:unnamed protein product [Rotaria socialis]|uniref:U-box domain-containing protein n=1 Tax=Rotaria socialis TaxID=392032 RepID=A0A820V5Z2_9BILA|nr:unnamed protein product [Rotaria socialis]CAF4496405.1 unnamed protein product [Rotaria socialis]